jgi:uncharacterized membrane protein YtjA (UPF0391 family)
VAIPTPSFTAAAPPGRPESRSTMLSWSLLFLVLAIVAGVFGFAGIASMSAGIAKILFFVFLILFLASLLMGRRPKGV